MNEKTISIFQEIGGPAAVSTEDGENLFKNIATLLQKDAKISLDFGNIETITSTFLNAAIGQLYGKYKGEFLRSHLSVENLSQEDLQLLRRVVLRAKDYFNDRGRIEDSIDRVLGNGSDS